MGNKLTWGEIKRRYPDEFVALLDPEHDESTALVAATVVAHGKDKREMYKVLKSLNARHMACRWTGQLHGGRVRLVSKVGDE